MDFLNHLFSNIQTSIDPLAFVGVIVTCVFCYFTAKHESSNPFLRECHDKLIFPLFSLLEPILYKEQQSSTLLDVTNIVDANKNLVDGKLLELFYFYSNNPSGHNFHALCSYVDKAYDRSCRKLGLKTRSITYRLLLKQFRNKLQLFSFIAWYLVITFLSSAIILFVALYVIGTLYLYFQSLAPMQQIFFFLICSFPCALILYRIYLKH